MLYVNYTLIKQSITRQGPPWWCSASNEESVGLIPGPGTKIPHAAQSEN